MAWLTDFSYRKAHWIGHSSGAGTDYQIPIITHYGSGSDSGEDVYLNGHCRSDFGDIRFTDDDGQTELDYWMESKTDGTQARFWLEVKDNLDAVDRKIYVYYGNSSAQTTSNFDNTFIFGDPFDSSTLNTTRWPSVDGNPTYSIDPATHILEVTNCLLYTSDAADE